MNADVNGSLSFFSYSNSFSSQFFLCPITSNCFWYSFFFYSLYFLTWNDETYPFPKATWNFCFTITQFRLWITYFLLSPSWNRKCSMSMFFFRLHNLQREEANKKKKKIEQFRQRRGAKVFRRVSRSDFGTHLTVPSRLFEKTPMNPSDSLDEIALQIPRFETIFFTFFISSFPLSSQKLNEWRT